MLHGHVHATYGKRFKRVIDHPSGTRMINGFEKYILEFDESRRPSLTRKELIKRLMISF